MTKTIIEIYKSGLTSIEVFNRMSDQRQVFFLDSGMNKTELGKFSFLGCNPFKVIKAKANTLFVEDFDQAGLNGPSTTKEFRGDPFEFLDDIYKTYQYVGKEALPFVGGMVGYLSYELCHFIEKLPRTTVDDVNIPDMYFGIYQTVIVFNHEESKIYITDLNKDDQGHHRIEALKKIVERKKINTAKTIKHHGEGSCIKSNFEKEVYKKQITKVREYIRNGDIYQVNMTQRFSGKMATDSVTLYNKLRQLNPAPFASYLDFDEGQIVSSSPERFIRVKDGIIETRPIKGTRPRGKTPEEDQQNREALFNSEKDRAELLMIVDLQRNDLSKVAKTGTVEVTELFKLESYATVHHLVATVRADVRDSLSPIDVIKATFPGGSITGAPKIRAMEIIDELEPTGRNIYTGSIGYIGFNGELDLNIVIRTFVCKDGNAYFQAGGGIVWDSDEEEEYQESLDKARALKNALKWGSNE